MNRGQFSAANAAAMAAKAHVTRKANGLQRSEEVVADEEAVSVAVETEPLKVDSSAKSPMITAKVESGPKRNEYLSRRLARVRRQLNRVDSMLLSEDDPARLDRLSACAARLEEQERRLSDRSLPATVKAAEKRAPKVGPASQAFTPSPAPPSPTRE